MLIDGVPGKQVPAADRGLNYGDGVFRTMRVTGCEPVAWNAQMACLMRDCQRLALPRPDTKTLYREARELFANRHEGVLKIVITRGSGGRGYAPPEPAEPLRMVSAHPAPRAVGQLALQTSAIGFPCQPALAGIKHLNRLEQVLARAECAQHGWADALMLSTEGHVISTTMRNIVLAMDGCWLTPALDKAGVAGATRARIMTAVSRAGRPITEARLLLSDCYAARAMIACNSVSGITPVVRLGTHELPDSMAMAADCRARLNEAQACDIFCLQ